MAKFEYLLRSFSQAEDKKIADDFNALGQDGWDLVFLENTGGFKRAVFKREIDGDVI